MVVFVKSLHATLKVVCDLAPAFCFWRSQEAFVSLFFAVFRSDKDQEESQDEETDGAVWMLHPLELNALTESIGKREFPNTWANHKGNVASEEIWNEDAIRGGFVSLDAQHISGVGVELDFSRWRDSPAQIQ